MGILSYLSLAQKARTAAQVVINFNIPVGTVGVAYAGTVTGTNVGGATGSIEISVDQLPPGLVLGTSVDNGDGSYTAAITGTPTEPTGDTPFVANFTATNGVQTGYLFDANFIVNSDAGIAIDINLPDADADSAYSGYVHGTNTGGATGTITYSAVGLPDGLAIDEATGAVTGTTGAQQTVTATFTVTNGTQTVHPTHQFVIGTPVMGLVATVTGTLDDGTQINVSVPQGSRIPLVPGTLRGSVMFHADGLSICLENAYAGLASDLTGVFTIVVGGTQIFSGSLTIYAYSRTRPWWITQPTVKPDADLSIFQGYGAGSEEASKWGAYSALSSTEHDPHCRDNTPMGIGIARYTWGAPGETGSFGPLPIWDAVYLTNPSDENLIVVRGMADSVGVWPAVVLDASTNKMIRVQDYSKLTMDGGQRGVPGNPITAFTSACQKQGHPESPLIFDQETNHNCTYGALACALFGTDFDKEALALWANYIASICISWPYRSDAGCILTSRASRGVGRSLRSVLYAALLSDDPDYFLPWLDSYATQMTNRLGGQTGLHICQAGALTEGYNLGGAQAFAPWQEHAVIQAVGACLLNGFTQFQVPFDYLCEWVFETMLDSPHEYASLYEAPIKDLDGNIVADWATALQVYGSVNGNVSDSLQYPENDYNLIYNLTVWQGPIASNYVAGDFTQYPWDTTYEAWKLQMAVATVAQFATDQTKAQACWQKCLDHTRFSAAADDPRYNVWPAGA
jgi:hypothetical protein